MDTFTQKDLREIYDSLPEDLRIAIFSPESSDVYNQIQERYALDAHQREELSIQSGLLMMGITEPKEYVLVLAEKLGVPRDKAAFIAQEVNRNILHPVRDSLKEIHAPMAPSSAPAPTPIISPIATPPPAIPPASTSSFDQKLGGTFRVSAPPQASVPNYSEPSAPPPVPIPPPPAPPATPSTPRANDPYREPPL